MKRLLTTTIIIITVTAVIILNYPNLFTKNAVAKSRGNEALTTAQSPETYGKMPLSFEQNYGQTDAPVKFLSRGAGYALFLTEREAVLRLRTANFKTDEPKKTAAKDCAGNLPTAFLFLYLNKL